MTRIICRLVAILLLLVPLPLAAQTVQSNEAKYIVFIHTGPVSPDHPSVRQIAGILVRSGNYVVRAPDNDRDLVGGPGIDYFSDAALPAATQLAASLNELLSKIKLQGPEQKPLKPRKQSAKNPANYLGVWLF